MAGHPVLTIRLLTASIRHGREHSSWSVTAGDGLHRGKVRLEEKFLKPLGPTKYRLAKNIGVPAQRIDEIVSGKRSVTADTDLRPCRYFGLSDGWWLRGQVAYDTAIAKEALAKALASIQRCNISM